MSKTDELQQSSTSELLHNRLCCSDDGNSSSSWDGLKSDEDSTDAVAYGENKKIHKKPNHAIKKENSSFLLEEVPASSFPRSISPTSLSSIKEEILSDPNDDSESFFANNSSRKSLPQKTPNERLGSHSALTTPCTHCATMEQLLTTLTREVIAMGENLAVLTSIVKTAIRHQSPEVDMKQIPSDLKFPASSLQDLAEIEKKLQDETLQETLVNQLRNLGGKSVGDFVKRAMPMLITNNVAMCCNLKGRNNKKAFEKSPLYMILFNAAKRNARTAECTLMDLELALSRWLVGSRNRCGNRARREKRSYGEAFSKYE